MFNKIRWLIIVLLIGLAGLFGFSFINGTKNKEIPIHIRSTAQGVDIEIENFKVTHDVLGHKDWEVNAKLAQVDNDQNTISLNDVNVTLNMDNHQKSYISADHGTVNNQTREIELAGNVHFVANADQFLNRFRAKVDR